MFLLSLISTSAPSTLLVCPIRPVSVDGRQSLFSEFEKMAGEEEKKRKAEESAEREQSTSSRKKKDRYDD